MCYSGKCKYEDYEGECYFHDEYPADAYCTIHEAEIFRYEMELHKKDFKYLVFEATHRDEIMEKLKACPENKDWTEQDYEEAIFIAASEMFYSEGGRIDWPFTDIDMK